MADYPRMLHHSPKRVIKQGTFWYDYYAGYSPEFVCDAIKQIGAKPGQVILDPWNGSGTTTHIAYEMGFHAIGFDLNPAMVIIAKARSLDPGIANSIPTLADDIINKAQEKNNERIPQGKDPLLTWFSPSSCNFVRNIESALQKLLVNNKPCYYLAELEELSDISTLAAFFYVSLFKLVREVLRPFRTSNPTWIKEPRLSKDRLNISRDLLCETFLNIIEEMFSGLKREAEKHDNNNYKQMLHLRVASSDQLPLNEESVDAVITSPPYCTRIDYIIATQLELALLGYGPRTRLRALREKMIGSPTICRITPEPSEKWGPTCNNFLEAVKMHPSKASRSYYLKGFLQYFNGVFKSLTEINRTLRPGGSVVLVIQDSYYKDIHNNLTDIYKEMANHFGWVLNERFDFPVSRTIAIVNRSSKKYRSNFSAVESALYFKKPLRKGLYNNVL